MNTTDTPIDYEMEIIVWSLQRFPKGHPTRIRLEELWREAAMSGALRENFPPGTEYLKDCWYEALEECRRMAQ